MCSVPDTLIVAVERVTCKYMYIYIYNYVVLYPCGTVYYYYYLCGRLDNTFLTTIFSTFLTNLSLEIKIYFTKKFIIFCLFH